ncbi:MBL fold metallo-hydrolase [Roseomonas stagni]|uniref:MBL fold metallo-hydrolase n=1 Tax=Falsiroseomonas algicola TaxID=2716930 RepID=A0A6M1LR49_9PROT|nr:MBL fold metallo-hydrolase [Falsiroseomonas algicola]NGM22482.1 MBL fold metallo-hydrolase [Falsiroseomonas algicola]
MKIHHLDLGHARPLGGRLMDGISPGPVARLSCHCLLIETPAHGLVLVDTGFGLRDCARPTPRLPAWNLALLRPRLDPDRTAIRWVKRLGFKPTDVRHIVMTHLDFDHAGGLIDFPHATVHLSAAEADAAVNPRGFRDRTRWRPAQWGYRGRWQPVETRLGRRGGGERFFGLPNAREIADLPPEFLMVPLPGHSPGHVGVAVKGPRGWMLHAGDAYFNRAEVHGDGSAPPLLAGYERLMADDDRQQRDSQARLRAMLRAPDSDLAVFCTHDAVEFVAMAAWSESDYAPPMVAANDAAPRPMAGIR